MSTHMHKTTMLFIQKTLAQCNQCTGFDGAVLSSPEGLILSASGSFSSDEAAACASSLMMDSSGSLELITERGVKEMLIWSEEKLFSLRRLQEGSILMIASGDQGAYMELRHMVKKVARQLDMAIKMLD